MVKVVDLYKLIEAAHAPPEWACFPEVSNATGGRARRRADAIAMSLWPSRGLIIRGFEIKQSRSDLKRESKDPEKAETVARFCDEWWFVTPEGLVNDIETEIPPRWGLMEACKKGHLRTRKKAERTDAAEPNREFLAAVLRRAQEHMAHALKSYVRRSDIAEEIEQAEARGEKKAPLALSAIKGELGRANRAIEAFAKESGIKILEDHWHDRGEELGKAVRVGMAILGRYNSNLDMVLHHLAQLKVKAEAMEEDLKEVLGDIA